MSVYKKLLTEQAYPDKRTNIHFTAIVTAISSFCLKKSKKYSRIIYNHRQTKTVCCQIKKHLHYLKLLLSL